MLHYDNILLICYWPTYAECKGGRLITVAGVCRRLSWSFVGVCNTRICTVTPMEQHATAGQQCYAPLGRQLVKFVRIIYVCLYVM